MDGEVYCFRNTKTDKKLGYKNFWNVECKVFERVAIGNVSYIVLWFKNFKTNKYKTTKDLNDLTWGGSCKFFNILSRNETTAKSKLIRLLSHKLPNENLKKWITRDLADFYLKNILKVKINND
jgi:hypothetical protein